MRAAFRSPHEPVTDHEGESTARVAEVEVALDHLLDDRPEKTALIRFAPEDCKARTPARNDSHTQSGTCRNDGTAPERYARLNQGALLRDGPSRAEFYG